jgi:hypothetical protein
MSGSARWDQDQPEDSRESTIDLPRLTSYPESPEPPRPRAASAPPFRAAPRRPPPPGGRRPGDPWLDGPGRSAATGSWDETGSWPTRSDPDEPPLPEAAAPVPAGWSESGPARPVSADPAPAPAGEPDDPALTALAERIREFQALAGRPAPPRRGGEPSRARSEPSFSVQDPSSYSSDRPGPRSSPSSPAGARIEAPAPASDSLAPRRRPAISRSAAGQADREEPAAETAVAARGPVASPAGPASPGGDLGGLEDERLTSAAEAPSFPAEPDLTGDETAISRTEPGVPDGPDVSQSHANSEAARQDYLVSAPRAAEPPSAADGEYAAYDDPAPASRGRGGEYFSSQGYTSGQEHRAMDRRRGPADGAGLPSDRPARGSLAELRLRLERLPAGHPSSPYDETGARRPAPEQLRQLELPLADEDEHHARPGLLAPPAPSAASDHAPSEPGPAGLASPAGLAAYGLTANGPAGHGASANGPGGNGLSANGLSANGLSANGLSANGLSGNGPRPNWLAGSRTGADGRAENGSPGTEYGLPDDAASYSGQAENESPGAEYGLPDNAASYGGQGETGSPGAEYGLPDNAASYSSRAENGMSANGRSENGSGRPSYGPAASDGQRDFGPAQPGAASVGPIEPGSDEEPAAEAYDPDEYGSDRFAAGQDRDEFHPAEYDQPGHDQPGHDQPGHDQPGHDQPEHDQPEHDWSWGDRFGPSPAGDGRNGNGARDARDAPVGNGSARLAAFAPPAGNGSRRPEDFARGEPLPQAPGAAASARPARNGSGHSDDPASSGLMPRVTDPEPRPARNDYGHYDGFRDHDDLASPDPGPRIAAAPADARPARNGSGRPAPVPESGPLPLPESGLLPRRVAGDLISPRGGGPDDPLSDDRPGADPAAGQDGHARSHTSLGELERSRTAARSGPASYDRGRPLPREQSPGPAARQRHQGLTAEQEAIADQALSRYQAADGRNVFGGYGESGLTPAMRRIEAQLPHGRLVPDSDENSLKSPERFKDKLARMIARHPGLPPADLAAEIYDAARYAFVFEPQDYTDGTWLVHRRLKAQGFDLEARRNRWDTPEFKGIRTRWRDPAHDLPFEVQFHTPASWAVVQRTYDAYVRITDPQTSAEDRSQLRERQVAAAAGTPLPARYAEIGDFRADVR